jgi:hypothetical protein
MDEPQSSYEISKDVHVSPEAPLSQTAAAQDLHSNLLKTWDNWRRSRGFAIWCCICVCEYRQNT